MNDLNLRVSGGIGEKVKKAVAPISTPYWVSEMPGPASDFIKEFLNSKSADEQLKLLKKYLNNNKELCDKEIIEFLVLLFWHADAKHPVKGFLKKHITESRTLRDPFVKRLMEVITDDIKESAQLPYCDYISVVTRLDACIDKFPPGASAVSSLEIKVAMYLLHCLESCVATLSNADGNLIDGEPKVEPLAPTEVNKIYDLAHLSLRLLLYMIQKVTDGNRRELNSMFQRIRVVTAELMNGEEVPMDTKSVSSIVALNLHLFENGPDSWIELLEKEPIGVGGTVELCLYSAIATAVGRPALVAAAGPRPALLDLADRILDIGDRYSSSPSHSLAVARTLLAVSKALAGAEPALARPLVAALAGYCWPHLEHHMDSVRHLAGQIMGNVVGACVEMEKQGDPSPLGSVFSALESLGGSRRWAVLGMLAERVGARVLTLRPGLVLDAAAALSDQPQQASATIFLETLLKRYMQESTPESVNREYVQVILEAAKREAEPSALGILETLLAKAVQWDKRILEYIIPDKSLLHTYKGSDLKCILLVLGVVRKSGADYQGITCDDLEHTAYDSDDEVRMLALSLAAAAPRSTQPLTKADLRFVLFWLKYNINAQAPAYRQLLLANMKKILKRMEDSLKVHIRTERHLYHTQSIAYINFVLDLRQLCFDSLVVGANYGRRCCALQLLAWQRGLVELIDDRPWTEERAELLYNVLEDTYENNKALALEVLKDCPSEYISKIEGPPDAYLTQLLSQASSVKPTECVSASYKLLLLCRRAGCVPLTAATEGYPERAWYCVLRRLLAELRGQAARAQDLLAAARAAPMFGLLHAANRAVGCLHARAIAGHPAWSELISDMIEVCSVVCERVEPVVSADSPEGLLPEEPDGDGDECLADGRPVTAQMVLLCAWRSVKESSLLLSALVSRLALEGEDLPWSLSAAQVEGVGGALTGLLGRLRHRGAFEQVYVALAALLTRLWQCRSARLHQLPLQWFAEIERDLLLPAPPPGATEYCATRRGAGLPFMIQALVTTELAACAAPRGRLLARALALCLAGARGAGPAAKARAHLVLRALFRHAAPPAADTAAALTVAVRGLDAHTWTVSGTLTPAVLRALCRHTAPPAADTAAALTVAVRGLDAHTWTVSGTLTPAVLRALCRHTAPPAADTAAALTVAVRGLDAHTWTVSGTLTPAVLRALCRHTAPPAADTAAALTVAVRGLDAHTWTERNSATLLFATLCVRVFGVPRARDARRMNARNRMTGRIFFLKYPDLYDFMLEQLSSPCLDSLRPSLFPTLLLLARLYPSALEGTVSNLKLERFLPLVQALAGASDINTRRLAARAAQPLLAPHRYIPHLQSLFAMLGYPKIKMNLCHGILCQLSVLLEQPSGAAGDGAWLPAALRATLRLAVHRCYIVADEYLRVLLLTLLRFPTPGLLDEELTAIAAYLDQALFSHPAPPITSGREVYLANAVYMYLIILIKCEGDAVRVTLRCLTHQDYEVQLSALNYLLTLQGHCDDPCEFLQHLSDISNGEILSEIQKKSDYMHIICEVSKSKYAECKQKALKVLSLTPGCPEPQFNLVLLKLATNEPLSYDSIVAELLDSALNGAESLRHIYLESLVELVSQYKFSMKMLPVLRALLALCSAEADECSRAAVVTFLEKNYARLLKSPYGEKHEMCSWQALVSALAAILLEDAAPGLRARTAAAVANVHGNWPLTRGVALDWLAARAAEYLREHARLFPELLLILAALDFRAARASASASAHRLGDECRVFDQSETNNVYLEEFTWTRECAKKIKENYKFHSENRNNTSTIEDYVASLANENRSDIEQLCIEDAFACFTTRSKSVHPKMDLFWKVLHQ